MEYIVTIILDILIYALIGVLASWFFYYHKHKDLLGGFWGGIVIGIVGAVITNMVTGVWILALYDEIVGWVRYLMAIKEISEGISIRVNLLTAIFGAFFFVYIFNRINHNRERRK